jgi:hypothetical protein
MKHDWLLKYALPALLIGTAIAGGIYQTWQHQHNQVTRITCAAPMQGCAFQLDQQPVQVEFVEPPSGLHPFTLRVITPHAQEIHAHFTMQEMEMGYNQYQLISQSPQHWQARVVLPVCVTGRHDWILTLNIDGKQVEIPFSG